MSLAHYPANEIEKTDRVIKDQMSQILHESFVALSSDNSETAHDISLSIFNLINENANLRGLVNQVAKISIDLAQN
jgi:hypothetical protein